MGKDLNSLSNHICPILPGSRLQMPEQQALDCGPLCKCIQQPGCRVVMEGGTQEPCRFTQCGSIAKIKDAKLF